MNCLFLESLVTQALAEKTAMPDADNPPTLAVAENLFVSALTVLTIHNGAAATAGHLRHLASHLDNRSRVDG